MSELGPVVVRQTIDAEQSEVWQALTNAEHRAPWWPSLKLTPQIGGEVSDSWEAESGETRTLAGTVDVLVPGLTVGFRWREADHPADRTVVVMIRPEDDDFAQTRVTVIESGFASLPNTAEAVQESTERWTTLIGTLEGLHAPEIPEMADANDAVDASTADAEDAEPEFIEADAIEDEVSEDEAPTDDTPSEVISDDAVTEEDTPEDEASSNEAPEADRPEDDTPGEAALEEEDAAEVASETAEAANAVTDELEVEEPVPFVEILEEDIVEGETIDDEFNPSDAILLPEVGASLTESVHITADLGVDEPVEVEELSEWELLLRGENPEDH